MNNQYDHSTFKKLNFNKPFPNCTEENVSVEFSFTI